MGVERFLCLICQHSPHYDMEIQGKTDICAGSGACKTEGLLEGWRAEMFSAGAGQVTGSQASVIPILWELRIRKEERRKCRGIAGNAASVGGGLGFKLCFLFPFYCSL